MAWKWPWLIFTMLSNPPPLDSTCPHTDMHIDCWWLHSACGNTLQDHTLKNQNAPRVSWSQILSPTLSSAGDTGSIKSTHNSAKPSDCEQLLNKIFQHFTNLGRRLVLFLPLAILGPVMFFATETRSKTPNFFSSKQQVPHLHNPTGNGESEGEPRIFWCVVGWPDLPEKWMAQINHILLTWWGSASATTDSTFGSNSLCKST